MCLRYLYPRSNGDACCIFTMLSILCRNVKTGVCYVSDYVFMSLDFNQTLDLQRVSV